MDYPLILITRLDEYTLLCDTKSTLEKAILYASTRAIRDEFTTSKLWDNHVVQEEVEQACYYICAAIGYNSATSKSTEEYIYLAQTKLETLRNTINILYY